MDQFNNTIQTSNYDSTRPKYTKDIFTNIISKINQFDYYLDIACGTGQLLFQLSDMFKKSIGVDISEEQIKIAKTNLKNNNTYLYTSDIYDLPNIIPKELRKEKLFDLITIGQAFHWFDPENLIIFIKNILLSETGTLVILGYQKQHFYKNDILHKPFQKFIDQLKPYFECDCDYNDSGYSSSNQLFKNNFKFVNTKYFTEEQYIKLYTLIKFCKSWSAYYNYMKKNPDDPINDLEQIIKNLNINEDINFYNFYFMITLHD